MGIFSYKKQGYRELFKPVFLLKFFLVYFKKPRKLLRDAY